MFRELMPILEGRTLMLTLSGVDENLIRVCVIPQQTNEATGENALCTPLTVTGTVDELDREFAVQLSGYTTAVVKLGSNLSAIEAAHSAALKTVEEDNKKDLDRKRGKTSGSKTTSSAPESKAAPASKDGKPVVGPKGRESSAAAPTLFDAPPELWHGNAHPRRQVHRRSNLSGRSTRRRRRLNDRRALLLDHRWLRLVR